MDTTERVARAIWDKRRECAKRHGIDLEEWGDGRFPTANHVLEEANVAIDLLNQINANEAGS